MTPKEKAKELVDKFYQTTPNESWFNPPIGLSPNIEHDKLIHYSEYLKVEYKAFDQAKQCALIAVNEIIKTLNDDIQDINVIGNILLDLIDYWREVKIVIEKL